MPHMVRLTSRRVRKKGFFCIGSISVIRDRKEFQAKRKGLKVKDIIIIIMLGISMDRIRPKALKVRGRAHPRVAKERVGVTSQVNLTMALVGEHCVRGSRSILSQ
jgi:hypothetical protein